LSLLIVVIDPLLSPSSSIADQLEFLTEQRVKWMGYSETLSLLVIRRSSS
jgi:hypothetical protein